MRFQTIYSSKPPINEECLIFTNRSGYNIAIYTGTRWQRKPSSKVSLLISDSDLWVSTDALNVVKLKNLQTDMTGIPQEHMRGLRFMATVLIIDWLATKQEIEKDPIAMTFGQLIEPAKKVVDGVDPFIEPFMEILPGVLTKYEKLFEPEVNALLPDMLRIINNFESAWSYKASVMQLATQFGFEKVYMLVIGNTIGGVALEDILEIAQYLRDKGCCYPTEPYSSLDSDLVKALGEQLLQKFRNESNMKNRFG